MSGGIWGGVMVGIAVFFFVLTCNYVARRWPAVAVAANAMGAEQAVRHGQYGKAAAYGAAGAIAYQQHRAKQDYNQQYDAQGYPVYQPVPIENGQQDQVGW